MTTRSWAARPSRTRAPLSSPRTSGSALAPTSWGFPPGLVAGQTHAADAVALQAQIDLTAAYGDAAGRTPFTPIAVELGGTTLTPGVYRLPSAQITGTLTLDTLGDPAAVFIFQVDDTLITGAGSEVVFLGAARSCSVHWQVASSATLGTDSTFVGTIMAAAAISLNTGADLEGRALARIQGVTLDNNTITTPVCNAVPPVTTPVVVPPVATPPGDGSSVAAAAGPPPAAAQAPVAAAPASPAARPAPRTQRAPAAQSRRAGTDSSGRQELSETGAVTYPLAAASGLLVLSGAGLLVLLRRRAARE